MSDASSVICAFTEASSARRSSGGSARPVASLRSSSSILVRREVSGVRSSCPASAISCCCRSRDDASAAVIALKDVLSRAISSCPSTGIRTFRSSVRAMCSTVPVSVSTGRSPARAIHRPADAAPSTPTPVTASSTQARVSSAWLFSVSGRATEAVKPMDRRWSW